MSSRSFHQLGLLYAAMALLGVLMQHMTRLLPDSSANVMLTTSPSSYLVWALRSLWRS